MRKNNHQRRVKDKMELRKICAYKNCQKSLFPHNKSGYCNYHCSRMSEACKKAAKKYSEKIGKELVKGYTRTLSILKDRHLNEFNEIYGELKEKIISNYNKKQEDKTA